MRPAYVCFAAGAMAALLSAGAGAVARRVQAQEPAAPAGEVAAGKQLYVKYGCYQCHGLQGATSIAPRLGPEALPFPAFSMYARAPTGDMPPYTEKVVTDQEMAHIHAYVRTLPAPSPEARDLLK